MLGDGRHHVRTFTTSFLFQITLLRRYLNHGAEQCNSAHECYSIDHLRNIDGFKAMSDEGRARILGGEMALWEVPASQVQVCVPAIDKMARANHPSRAACFSFRTLCGLVLVALQRGKGCSLMKHP